jgi:hypothetical protein
MEQTPYDARIAELKVAIERLRLEMEAVSKEFINAAIPPVQAWFKKQIEASVKKDPDHLATLSSEQVRLVKSDLQQLADSAPDIVRKRLDRDSCWIHRLPVMPEIHSYPPIRNGVPPTSSETRDEAFREIMGATGSLLMKHGFTKLRTDYKGRHHGPMAYLGTFPYSSQMRSNTVQYGQLSAQYMEAHKQLRQAEQDRTQHQANHLWDSN